MELHFSLETAAGGSCRIAVRDANDAALITSGPLPDTHAGMEAIGELRLALQADWRYQIVRRRGEGPRFVIHILQQKEACTSVAFSSCDAMERAISALKACASAAQIATRPETSAFAQRVGGKLRVPRAGMPQHPGTDRAPTLDSVRAIPMTAWPPTPRAGRSRPVPVSGRRSGGV